MSNKLRALPMQRDQLELSDVALVSACAAKDPTALAMLHRRHHAAVYHFLARLLGHTSADLDDVVQHVFLGAWDSAARFRGQAQVRSWLLGIAAHQASKHKRSQRRRGAVMLALLERPVQPPEAIDEAASRQQLVERIAVAIEELPHDLKVAYVLCELEELPGVEAARAIGVRPGTMWRRLHQARRMLRELLLAEGVLR